MMMCQDTKLDVLAILTNLAATGGLVGREQVKACLMGVSTWFDGYLQEQGARAGQDRDLHKVWVGHRAHEDAGSPCWVVTESPIALSCYVGYALAPLSSVRVQDQD